MNGFWRVLFDFSVFLYYSEYFYESYFTMTKQPEGKIDNIKPDNGKNFFQNMKQVHETERESHDDQQEEPRGKSKPNGREGKTVPTLQDDPPDVRMQPAIGTRENESCIGTETLSSLLKAP
ncbi:hypothetical protein B9Z55_028572 [Caenorhabditis nigoni]|uniref:Uncharacterized protein n=2 Tax=Caenorhabditis nigoni TaxID=1611254 RepID=A0A2G5SBE2_9PELO|nr:hypothetical protein B9Z55_028572 [Caenorhabditis nigoni]